MEDIKERLLEYIRKNDSVSYAEIEQAFSSWGFNWKGSLEIYHREIPTIVFWTGWNKKAFQVLSSLENENLIHKEPCSTLIYLLDGKMPNYPLVKSYRHYKDPHWLPAVYRPGKRAPL